MSTVPVVLRNPAGAVLVLAVALLFVTVLSSSPAHAASTFTVNSTADPGTGSCDATECTLREAITSANATAGTDTINFKGVGGQLRADHTHGDPRPLAAATTDRAIFLSDGPVVDEILEDIETMESAG